MNVDQLTQAIVSGINSGAEQFSRGRSLPSCP